MSFIDIISKDTNLIKVSSTGEWAGPCPLCRAAGVPNGGKDRFHVKISSDGNDAKWFCRKCSPKNTEQNPLWQEPIQYIARRDKVSVFDARMKLENRHAPGLLTTPEVSGTATEQVRPIHTKPSCPGKAPAFIAPETIDRTVWRSRAKGFIEECRNLLQSDDGEEMRRELHNRGLKDATVLKYNLGFNPEVRYERPNEWGFSSDQAVYISAGLVIPWFMDGDVVAVNIRRFDEDPKYMVIRGSERSIFASDNLTGKQTALFVEGEFDCILADQEIGELTGCVTLGPATGKFNLA